MIYSSFDDAMGDMDPHMRSFYLFLVGAYADTARVANDILEIDLVGLSKKSQIAIDRYMNWIEVLCMTIVTKPDGDDTMHVPLMLSHYCVYSADERPIKIGLQPIDIVLS